MDRPHRQSAVSRHRRRASAGGSRSRKVPLMYRLQMSPASNAGVVVPSGASSYGAGFGPVAEARRVVMARREAVER